MGVLRTYLVTVDFLFSSSLNSSQACEFGAGSEMLHGRHKVPELDAALAEESFRFSANLEQICLDAQEARSKL